MKHHELLGQLTRTAPHRPPGLPLPTGSVPLDLLLGGGWPAGTISEISGPPGYATPAAYRTLAAVQRHCPGKPALLCCTDFSPRLARRHGVETGRLLVAHSHGDALTMTGQLDLSIAVVDATVTAGTPVRDDKDLTVLYLTRQPGEIRSAACIQLGRYPGSRAWAWADRMWHAWHPDRLRFDRMRACTGKDAFTQELLDIALVLDVAVSRARWYYYGERRLGNGWDAAVTMLNGEPGLRAEMLAGIAGRAPVHPEWRKAYA